MSIAVVIPSYDPDAGLFFFLEKLRTKCGWLFLVVDDGSRPESKAVFERVAAIPNCIVLRHAVNLGKGRALKTAFNEYLNRFPDGCGVVTADGDGQHDPDDILRCGETMMQHPRHLTLGVRDFTGRTVPQRSAAGNQLSKLVFSLLLRERIADTQTGLRGIPAQLLRDLMNTRGERFEYETIMLFDVKHYRYSFYQVPIRTIYEEGNRDSHFAPFKDTVCICRAVLMTGLSRLKDKIFQLI